MLGFLGIQEANRKRTVPNMTPEEWAETSANSSNDSTTGLVSVKKLKGGRRLFVGFRRS